jgi:hypothetical protein
MLSSLTQSNTGCKPIKSELPWQKVFSLPAYLHNGCEVKPPVIIFAVSLLNS